MPTMFVNGTNELFNPIYFFEKIIVNPFSAENSVRNYWDVGKKEEGDSCPHQGR